ncbi:hypothetical protein GCM10022420_028250 [Streptomyces iranensis]
MTDLGRVGSVPWCVGRAVASPWQESADQTRTHPWRITAAVSLQYREGGGKNSTRTAGAMVREAVFRSEDVPAADRFDYWRELMLGLLHDRVTAGFMQLGLRVGS